MAALKFQRYKKLLHCEGAGFYIRVTFAGALLLITVTASEQLAEAKRLYFEGLDGKQEAISRSAEMLERLIAGGNREAVVSAYLGSVRLMQASKAFAPWSKGKLAKEGLKLLDGAVEAAPHDIEIRFLRGASTFHLPSMFGREAQAVEDLTRIAPQVREAVAAGRLSPRIGAAALNYYGLARERAAQKGARSNSTGAAAAVPRASP
jgi:hypothetical protein